MLPWPWQLFLHMFVGGYVAYRWARNRFG